MQHYIRFLLYQFSQQGASYPDSTNCIYWSEKLDTLNKFNCWNHHRKISLHHWITTQKRLAMVFSMGPGLDLTLLENATNVPYLVAAQLHDGREQFLCPVVGRSRPSLESSVCHRSRIALTGNRVRVAISGQRPWVFMKDRFGKVDGVDIRLLEILYRKLNFVPDITFVTSYDVCVQLVSMARTLMLSHH